MNYFDSLNKTLCCGCTACVNSCLVSCIAMKEDEKGFLYPDVDKTKCIDCGLCKKVCPLADNNSLEQANNAQQNCYAFVANDPAILKNSTSGGAFITAAKEFCKEGGVVCGVTFNDIMTVNYSFVKSIDEIGRFSKSKYFQSELNDTFAFIKENLINNKKVVFSGTPCHVAGLRSYLGKDYNNLFCIDILCFGVPSKKAFLAYKDYLENKYQDKLIDFNFRTKENPKACIAIFEKIGKVEINSDSNHYMRGFYSKVMHRDCCSQCQFKRLERQGDISIGDFWGIDTFDKEIDISKGVSLVFFNNIKGYSIKNSFAKNGILQEYKSDIPVQYNQLNPMQWRIKDDFYQKINEGLSFDKVVDLYCKQSIKLRIKVLLSKVLPVRLKNIIKKAMGK